MVMHDEQLSRAGSGQQPARRRRWYCATARDVTGMGIVRRLAIGVGSLAVLVLLVVGVPALLLLVGFTPARAGIGSWPDLVVRLQMPDDGTLVGLILTAVAWIAWLYMVAAIVIEASAALRRIPAIRLPVLSLGQVPARRLVAGIALLFIATPVLASALPGPPAFATPKPVPPAAEPLTQEVVKEDARGLRTVTVERGDSLSKIAREYLGDGGRWDEIYSASKDVVQPGGRRLSDPDQIDIGWTLLVPGGTASSDQKTAVVVKRGDSLSKLARKYLGDAGRWDEIFQASTGIKQPGGRYLVDPDHIEPGWVLHLPTTTKHEKAPPADDPEPPADETPQESSELTATPDPTPADTASAVVPAPPIPASTPTPVRTPPTDGGRAGPTPAATSAAGPTSTPAEAGLTEAPAWLVPGLAGAGALLAGSLWLLLSRRRTVQFRARRPGRTIATPPSEHVGVEKTLMHAGGPTGDVIIQVDQGLRRLAATITAAGQPLPALLGVDVTPIAVAVVFTDPVELPSPWQNSGDATSWWIGLAELNSIDGFDPDSPPPWPQLVTIGRDDDDVWRLLNLETLGVVSLTGDPARAADLARYLATELATAPWARDVSIDCVGALAELSELNPVRLSYHANGSTVVDAAAACASAVLDRLKSVGAERVEAARVSLSGHDLWESRVLVADAATEPQQIAVLTDLIVGHLGRTATSVMLTGDHPVNGIEMRLDATGRVEVPALGLSLTANGLTADEAAGCVAVLSAADDLAGVEVPSPTAPTDPWQELCDASGNLRGERTLPRGTPVIGEEASTMLPQPDDHYLLTAATTPEDLAVMSPVVTASTKGRIEQVLASLDDELAAWHDPSCIRPRLQMLGPLKVRPGLNGRAEKVAKRFPYYSEIVAFLAEHPRGVTTKDIMAAFDQSETRVSKDMSNVREWLGANPRTGRPFLPPANDNPEAKRRGVGLYLIEDLLVDAHLLRQLRQRAKTRSGDQALHDLMQALQLVRGEPFDGLRNGGHTWLAESRADQNLHVAIIDTAHEAVTAALAISDLGQARQAAELAWTIAPYESTAVLDLATVMEHEGHSSDARELVRAMTAWTDGTGDGGPIELPDRAKEILRSHAWFQPTERAG
jgi:LysM repeat protein